MELNSKIDFLCNSDKPDGYHVHEDHRGTYIIHISNHMPDEIYAVMLINQGYNTFASQIEHLEKGFCLWGCDLLGYKVEVLYNTFRAIENGHYESEPWPQEVRELLSDVPHVDYLDIIHITNISYQ